MKNKINCPICKYHEGKIVSISSWNDGYYWLCPNCGCYSDIYKTKNDVIKRYKDHITK